MSREEVEMFRNRIQKLYLEHKEVRRLWSKFDSLRLCNTMVEEDEDTDERDPRSLFVTGLSGTGKSQIAKRYKRRNPGYTLETQDEEIDIKPVLYVKLPFPFTQLHFYVKILNELGTDNLRRDVKINYVKDRVLYLLKKQKTELIFFDEMDYIMRTKTFDNQSAMEMLKDLTNECQICIVCIGTPKIEPLRNMEDEYIRRFGKDKLQRFDTCNDIFCSLLIQIEDAIQPPKPIGLGDPETGYPQLLHYYSQGRIGYLHLIIKETYRLLGIFDTCDDFSKATITVDLLQEAKKNLFGENDHLVEPN